MHLIDVLKSTDGVTVDCASQWADTRLWQRTGSILRTMTMSPDSRPIPDPLDQRIIPSRKSQLL
jgi:hypothetical protein